MAHKESTPKISPLPLPPGISSRQIDLSQFGHLSFHILEAGPAGAPLLLLLHGFPELAYSWRKLILPLAQAGYHVVAPDQRGFGRTTGWDDGGYTEVDLHTFTATMLIRDTLSLVSALGYSRVKCVVGADAGATSAAACAVARPDIFESIVLMTHPFNGTPKLPFNVAHNEGEAAAESKKKSAAASSVHDELASLGRKHYKWYYSTAEANGEMTGPVTKDGLPGFLRGYFHVKSASWAGNKPHPLTGGWKASELAKLPLYYVMPLRATMPETIELLMKNESTEAIEHSKTWLSDEELEVYVSEYARTTFQGGLNWYRVWTSQNGWLKQDLDVFAGLKIKIPCAFIGGDKDWGTFQEPSAIEKMRDGTVCEDFRFARIIEGAGHWIAQEKPKEATDGILDLLGGMEEGS